MMKKLILVLSIVGIILGFSACSGIFGGGDPVLHGDIEMIQCTFNHATQTTGTLDNPGSVELISSMSCTLWDMSNEINHDPADYEATTVQFVFAVELVFLDERGMPVLSDVGYSGYTASTDPKSLEFETSLSLREILGTSYDQLVNEYDRVASIHIGGTVSVEYSWDISAHQPDGPDGIMHNGSVEEEFEFIID